MSVPSSGGIAVAETLNLIEAYEAKAGRALSSLDDANYLHWFSEATPRPSRTGTAMSATCPAFPSPS